MELGIIGALAYLGNNYYSIENEETDYKNYHHNIDFTYHDSNHEKNIEKININSNRIIESRDPQKTNIVNNSIKPINNISLNYKDMNFYEENVKNLDNIKMFESFNQKLNNTDESFNDQFKPLVFDNKSEPSSVNQAHKSIDRNKFNSIERSLALGNDYSFFDNKEDMTYGIVKKEEFKHNNMVPHFSKKQVINDTNEQTIAHKVDIFSGSSRNFIPKKELLQENFAPIQKDVSLIGGIGSGNKLDAMQSYYLPSKEKRNILPFEQQNIGPGLNLSADQTTRADGGNFEEYRPLPKTVDQLRSADRPKLSYEGVIIPGQKGNKGQTIGKVFKRGPEKTKEVDPKTYQPTGGVNTKQSSRDKVILKNTNRRESKPEIGPAKFANNKLSNKNTSKTTDSTKKEGFTNGPTNAQHLVKKYSQNKCSYKLPDTQRESTADNKHITHPHKFSLGKVKFDPHDLPRQTIKQTTLYNEQGGIAKGPENKVTTYDPSNVPRVTRKETTLYNEQSGHASDISKVTTYNPNDVTRTTLRQDTQFNDQAGYAQGVANKVLSYNPDDVTRTTLRQDTQFNEQSGYARGLENKVTTYNPDDITRTTIRQDTQFNEQAGFTKGLENKISTHNPQDTLRPTIRQDTQFNEQILNAHGMENKVQTHNPDDLLRLTQRQDLAYNNDILNVRGEVNINQSYDPSDLMKHTQREELVYTDDITNVLGEVNAGQAYDPNNKTRPTTREDLVYNNHLNHARNDIDGPVYFNPTDTSRPTIKEETIFPDRYGHVMNNNTKPNAFDPTDVPASTLKELLIHQYDVGVAQGTVNKGTVFNPKDVPAETLKQMCILNDYISNANKEDSKGGYQSNKFVAPETLRQLIQAIRFGGALGDEAPRNYTAEQNMELDDRKEISLKSRIPTNRKHDAIPNTNTNVGDMHLRETFNVERTPLIDRANFHSNNFNLPTNYTQSTYRNNESNRLNPEILNQLNNNPLVNNVVISQPDNSDDNIC